MQVHIIEMLKIWEDRLNAVGLQDAESDRHFHIIAVVMISNISNTRYLTFDKICKHCNDEQNQGQYMGSGFHGHPCIENQVEMGQNCS
jgi:nitrate reductase beta subunit